MRKSRKALKLFSKIALTALIITSLLVCSCKDKKSAEIPVLKFTKSISPHPLFFIADKDGLAVKNGINPKIELSDDLESIITGKNDAKLNDLIPPLVSAASGADLVIFAGSMTGGHILFANKEVAEELKIRAIRDIFYYRIF